MADNKLTDDPVYLGDTVYVRTTADSIEFSLRGNAKAAPHQVIHLIPEVYMKLRAYVEGS